MNSAKKFFSNLGSKLRTPFSSDVQDKLEQQSSRPYNNQRYEFAREDSLNVEHLQNTKTLQTNLPGNENTTIQSDVKMKHIPMK